MNALAALIDTLFPDRYVKFALRWGLTPGELVLVLILFVAIALWNLLLRGALRRWLKGALYRRRSTTLYRLLFHRIDKLIRPVRYLVSFYLFKKAMEILVPGRGLEDLFYVLFVLLGAWWFYEIVKFLLYAALAEKIQRQRMARRELFNLFLNITKVFIFLAVVVLILSHMGVDLTALITSLGIGGVIVGLSAKDTLTNFFDSIRLVSEDALRQGDWIETGEIEGFVTEMGLTSTKIRTFDNAMVTVPNTLLANGYVKNWTKRMVGRRIKFHLRLKFTDNLKELERVIYEIHEMLHSHPDIVNENKVRYFRQMQMTYESGLFNLEDKYGVRRTLLVYLDEIGEYSMNVLIYCFSISVNWEEWLRVKQDVIKRILHIVRDSELELALPRNEILVESDEMHGEPKDFIK